MPIPVEVSKCTQICCGLTRDVTDGWSNRKLIMALVFHCILNNDDDDDNNDNNNNNNNNKIIIKSHYHKI